MTEFDPVRAFKIAKRLLMVEPDAAEQLFAAVEAFTQERLEQVDLTTHTNLDDWDIRR